MPFYEYQCKQCGHAMEAMQKIHDAPLKKCPECGKSALQRLMSAPVFRLKGAGWYETDFKSDQEGKKNLADRPEAEAAKEDKKDAKEGAANDPVIAKDDKTAGAKPGEKSAEKPGDKSAEKAPEKSAAKPAPKSPSSASPKPGTARQPSRRGVAAASARAKPKKAAKKTKRRR